MIQSKTPNFNKNLNSILDKLQPYKVTCQQCKSKFEIFKEDIRFYKILRIPPPKLCPNCRKQRRYGFYNNILKFYKKKCQAKNKEVISTFSPKSPYKIFNLEHWWSDKWGAEEYAQDYDFSKSFFKQFKKFNQLVPHPAILNYYKNIVNSPYTISTFDIKNCYFTALGGWGENMNYCYWVIASNDSFDLLDSESCENCYKAVGCVKCYNCKFCEESENCIDSFFIYGCYNCHNCFGCTNLRHKKYYIFNKQYTKKEYLTKINEINLGDRNVLEYYKKKFEKLLKETIRENLDIDPRNVNCVGDKLYQAKDCYQVFLTLGGTNKKTENVRYSTDVGEIKDCMDLYVVGPNVSLSYELIEAVDSSNIKFSYFTNNSLNLEYCLNCRNCQNCFGCSGLRNKKYYIFNKPYSKEEYFKKLDKIKTKMLQDGEYGEFFSLSQSLHPYNNTYAMIVFPLTKEEVLKKGWQWYDEPKIPVDLKGMKLIQIKDLPKDIKDVKNDILDKAVVCEASNKPFRIIKSELEFYRKHNLPIPTKHPYQRMMERFKKRNPTKLWEDTCDKCNKEMLTSYPPKKQKELKIYCKKCYNKEVG